MHFNMNDERFDHNDSLFSIKHALNSKVTTLYYWDKATHTVSPIIRVGEGKIILVWSNESQKISETKSKRGNQEFIQYVIPPFRTFENSEVLHGEYRFEIENDTANFVYERFLEAYLRSMISNFNQYKHLL